MPKHRKTLKEKKLADLRLAKVKNDHTPVSAESTPVVSITNKNLFQNPFRHSRESGNRFPVKLGMTGFETSSKYPYLMQEVQKIGIVTALIIAVQIILFFLLKKQILVLPMVKY